MQIVQAVWVTVKAALSTGCWQFVGVCAGRGVHVCIYFFVCVCVYVSVCVCVCVCVCARRCLQIKVQARSRQAALVTPITALPSH